MRRSLLRPWAFCMLLAICHLAVVSVYLGWAAPCHCFNYPRMRQPSPIYSCGLCPTWLIAPTSCSRNAKCVLGVYLTRWASACRALSQGTYAAMAICVLSDGAN